MASSDSPGGTSGAGSPLGGIGPGLAHPRKWELCRCIGRSAIVRPSHHEAAGWCQSVLLSGGRDGGQDVVSGFSRTCVLSRTGLRDDSRGVQAVSAPIWIAAVGLTAATAVVMGYGVAAAPRV